MKPRLRLHSNWRRIARHAWSVRLDVALIALETAQTGINLLSGNPPIDPVKFAGIAMAVTCLSLTARFVKQEQVSGEDQ